MFSQETHILMFLFCILLLLFVYFETNFFLSLSAETAMSEIAILGQGVIQI